MTELVLTLYCAGYSKHPALVLEEGRLKALLAQLHDMWPVSSETLAELLVFMRCTDPEGGTRSGPGDSNLQLTYTACIAGRAT